MNANHSATPGEAHDVAMQQFNQALQAGNVPRAIDLMRQAIDRDGSNAGYWSNLGHALRLAGRLPEAVRACEQAVLLHPNLPGAFYNLGLAWQGLGRLDDAMRAYQTALRLRPDYVEACAGLAFTLQARGDFRTASAFLKRALEIKPDYAPACNNLATIHKRLGELDEAISWYRQALRFRPDHAETHYNLGTTLQEQGDVEGAVACYRQALQIQPGLVEASNNLAAALTEQGLLQEAAAQWQTSLRLQPTNGLAYYNLDQFAAGGLHRFDTQEIARIRQCAVDEKLAPLERSHFQFTLANMLDRQGAYDAAFASFRTANDIRKSLLRQQNRVFDPQIHEARVNHTIATFDPYYFQVRAGWGNDTEVPVFIVGMPRSGTTLVEQILSSHSKVVGVGELEEIKRLLTALAKSMDVDINVHLPCILDDVRTRHLATSYLEKVNGLGKGAARVVDKTLDNSLRLGLIKVLYPRARIIYCRRDPLDVCLSCYMQNFRDLPFAWSLQDLGVFYRQFDRLMNHWRSVLPGPMHEIAYEALVADPDTEIRKLLAFCGLDWEDRCLTFYDNPRAVRTVSKLQVRNPLSGKSIGRWKKYAGHLRELMETIGILGDSASAR